MAMDFSKVKTLTIPEGSVSKITISNNIVWQKDTGGLPSEYQQIDYIYAPSNNGAYIDLGIQYAHGCTFEIGWVYTGNTLYLFGATDATGNYRCMLSGHYGGVMGSTYYITNSSGKMVALNYPKTDTTVGKLMNQKVIVKPGVSTSSVKDIDSGNTLVLPNSANTGDYTISNNLYLLGQNYHGKYRGNGLKQISYFKYWDNDENLLRDMIPCYRKSDNVIGMYDKVSKILFTNAGTGTFYKELPTNASDYVEDDTDII